MTDATIRYSVVIPVYRAERSLAEVLSRLKAVLQTLNAGYEIILVDDGSPDGSWEVMTAWRERDPRIRCFRLSRNFGQQNATLCGLRQARGQYVLTLDDDLQNPPEEIPRLIAELQRGYDAVFGVYAEKQHGIIRRLGSWLFNRLYAWTFQQPGPVSAFRLLTAELVQHVVAFQGSYTYLNGLIAWHTNRISRVTVSHQPRTHGRSGYSFRALATLAWNMIMTFSLLPARLALFGGMAVCALSIVGAVLFYFIMMPGESVPIREKVVFAILSLAPPFLTGLILATLGLVAEYAARIHQHLCGKPQYHLRKEDEGGS